MNRFANGILNHRKTVLAVFIIAALVCALLSTMVKINYKLTDYLPDDAPSTKALQVMEKSFNQDLPNTSVYIPNVSVPEALAYKAKLKALSGVENVLWLDDVMDVRLPLQVQNKDSVEAWYKDGGALFSVTVRSDGLVDTLASICNIAGSNGALTGDAVYQASSQTSVMGEISQIMLYLIILIVIILIISTSSWFEPVLFLAAIGIAILINLGTNIFQGQISFVTQSTVSILQLAVSMDYAIVLLHSFARHRREGMAIQEAMAKAMTGTFGIIASSAATAGLGFSVLAIMRFKIGPDMGLVLAKGVAISFICVAVLLPVLVVTFARLMEKTHHKPLLPSFSKVGKFVKKAGIPLAIVVLILIVPAYLAQQNNNFVYGSAGMQGSKTQAGQDESRITALFGKAQQMVLLVPDGNPASEAKLGIALKDVPNVKSVISYDTAVGAQIPAEVLTKDQVSAFHSGGFSRLILTVDTPDEGTEAFQAVEAVRSTAGQYYSEYYLVGESVVNYDLKSVITADNMPVTIALLVAVGIVLLIMFRSLSIPIILLIAIEGATWINLGIPYFSGDTINYIGYQIISAVQLGATVDYAILLTHHYLSNRKIMGKKDAVQASLTTTTPTIITPAAILIVAGFVLGLISSNGIIQQLGIILGRGTIISLAMVLLVLPGFLMLFDRFLEKTTYHARFLKGEKRK
ncbi:MAG: MMPL family transporter [Eubacteriales bacterium]